MELQPMGSVKEHTHLHHHFLRQTAQIFLLFKKTYPQKCAKSSNITAYQTHVQLNFIPVKHLLLVKLPIRQTKSADSKSHGLQSAEDLTDLHLFTEAEDPVFSTHVNPAKGTIFAITSSKGVVQTVMQNENSSHFILLFF